MGSGHGAAMKPGVPDGSHLEDTDPLRCSPRRCVLPRWLPSPGQPERSWDSSRLPRAPLSDTINPRPVSRFVASKSQLRQAAGRKSDVGFFAMKALRPDRLPLTWSSLFGKSSASAQILWLQDCPIPGINKMRVTPRLPRNESCETTLPD